MESISANQDLEPYDVWWGFGDCVEFDVNKGGRPEKHSVAKAERALKFLHHPWHPRAGNT